MIVTSSPRIVRTKHSVDIVVNSGQTWKGNLTLLSPRYCNMSLYPIKDDIDEEPEDTQSTTTSRSDSASDVVYSDKDRGLFSLYQVGDGSAEDLDGIPTRYLTMAQQDRHLALKAVQKTVEWRRDQGINDLLNEPHVNYDVCKQVVPHVFIGRDVESHVVYVQQPARFNDEQMQRNGLEYHDMLRHAIYVQEYLWQIIEAENPRATITSIIDVADLRFHQLGQKDQVSFLKEMATTFDAHFPMRAHKTIIVNAPKWFYLLYRMLKPLLRESTTAMVEICTKGKKQDAALRAHLGEETSRSLPDFCWSEQAIKEQTRKTHPGSAAQSMPRMEQELREHVMKHIKSNGLTMKPVLP
ncbi:Transfer protein [Seminavis robusta]|uniref:Transfer protein n=1 Tax=Seminavis robusta TaxID=568900 RepID=A0A9N8D5S5_9STRA|nr:Transfer protein [Seminavis robusta]|eukprot:Sro7_g005990.1 Transfer protein (354) ;mRNA; r:111974-113035